MFFDGCQAWRLSFGFMAGTERQNSWANGTFNDCLSKILQAQDCVSES